MRLPGAMAKHAGQAPADRVAGEDGRPHAHPPEITLPPETDPEPEAAVHGELRRSEEGETLHRLLVDTHQKIDGSDALKSALDDMMLPFRGAMRTLEQERALSSHLSRQLSEKAATCDKQRDELQHAENKVCLLENEVESLRETLDRAHESGRAMESARTLLGEEIERRDAKIAALERQLEQEVLQRRSFGEGYRALQEQLLRSDKRAVELQAVLGDAEQRCEALKQDKRSLWHSVEQAREDVGRLSRRLAEGEGALSAMRAELGKLEARHADVRDERSRLADVVDDLRAQQQAERQGFSGQIETLESRIAAAERQVAEMRQRLIERTEEARTFICKTAEATMARATAERRLAALRLSHGLRGRADDDPTEARTALSEFLRALNLKSREMALANAAEKMAAMGEPRVHSTAERGVLRASADRRAEGLVAALQDDHPSRSGIEKTLSAAREADARLEREVAGLNAELHVPARETAPVDTAPAGIARPNDRAGAAHSGGLAYEAGLVARLRGLADDDLGCALA